jgi:hypothetical protein
MVAYGLPLGHLSVASDTRACASSNVAAASGKDLVEPGP